MKLPEFKDTPEEEKPGKDPGQKRVPKRVVHRPMTVRRPEQADRKPAPAQRTRTPARPAPGHSPDPDAVPRHRAADRPEVPPRDEGRGEPRRAGKGINPGLRLRAFEAASRNAPPARLPMKYRLRPDRDLARRAAWDVAAVWSLVVNAILVAVLLLMAIQIRNLKSTLSGLLGGLYGNFVEMEYATIATTITVDTNVPLDFLLPVRQNTDVTLTRSVSIPGARVSITSGALTIDNAPANVTLPAGTNLPIALNMDIPVQVTVPVTLQVPVNIPLNQTQLRIPFKGLQNTIRPLYCALDRNAQYPQGVFICTEHDTPTPLPGAP